MRGELMVIHYKCPNCGSEMVFDSESGKLTCHSCGRQDNIEDFPEENIDASFEEDEAKEYNCKNCGANLITDGDTTATTCSFCGSPMVLLDRLSGALAPRKVIPFSVSKEEAQKAFRSWAKNGRITPRGFMTADRIKNITGMYVPFWLFDLNSDVKVDARGTKVHTYTRGEYIYTETSHYNIYRDINLDYLKIPVDASEKMDDELMDKLEPYQYDNLKEFKTPYLAGYIAEKYNYDEEDLLPRAKSRILNYINTYIGSTISGYSTVSYRDKDINTNKVHAYYTLLPVWMVYYDYKDAEYIFAMNGQTGKVVGAPPISKGKMGAWFASIFAGSFVLLKLISLIIGGSLW